MQPVSPVVSIITPAYNAAAYLPETAASVFRQTFTDWEWLIVDDGSTDDTVGVVERFTDPRVRLLRREHSGLPAVARNAAFAEARGEYVACLDADDLWLPRKLELQLRCFDEHPEVGLVFSRYLYYWFGPWTRLRKKPEPDLRNVPNPGRIFEILAFDNVICASSAVVRRSFAEAHGLMDEDPLQRGTEDYEYWLRLSPHAPFAYVAEPLVVYRIHPSGISRCAMMIFEGRVAALEKMRLRNPDVLFPPELTGRRFEARKLRWLGKAQLTDGVADHGRSALWRSLRIDPANPGTWAWFLLSLLGARPTAVLRRWAERIL